MKWISALQLEQWAGTAPARAAFPELVGDLIRASSTGLRSFRFPSGDKGQVRGFDGHLDSDAFPPFVPEGTSIWEFGVAAGAVDKFVSDLEKRTGEIDEDTRLKTTFVFVSPRTYDNPKKKLQDLVDEESETHRWRKVIYIDGVQLETWLSSCPAVAARYARTELQIVPQVGARSFEEFWDEYSNRYAPQLIEEVLLSGRASEAEEIVSQLTGDPNAIRIAADSPDEALAFVVAAVRKAEPETKLFIEARALVIDSDEAGRLLTGRGRIYLPRSGANGVSGALATKGSTILAIGRDQVNGEYRYLPKPSYYELGKALEGMGFDAETALNKSRACGRSITILQRQIPGGNVVNPPWIEHAGELVPAILAGGWDETNAPDIALIESLSGTEYRLFQRTLRTYASTQDPPLDVEGPVWKVRAPVDAFTHIGRWIDRENLEALARASKLIFSEVFEKPNEDDAFLPSAKRKHTYSNWLREGVATSLLQIAVLSNQAQVNVPGIEPPSWVDGLISSLPGLNSDSRVIASFRSELPLLMEAAPIPLLAALEQLLGGADAASSFFWNHDVFFGPTSPHVYILWALERLAWDPKFLRRTSLIIAKLGHLQGDVKSGNSPLESLKSIFIPWNPNTFANSAQRLAVLDAVLEGFPDFGWKLLQELLPASHDTNTPTSKPRYREASASNAEVLTYRLVWDMQDAVIDRVLAMTGGIGTRVSMVVDEFYNWSDDQKHRALTIIDAYLASDDPGRLEVWNTLRDLSNKHKTFSDTDWALKSEWIDLIDAIVEHRQPANKFDRISWLFDSYWPEMPGSFEEREIAATSAREKAVIELWVAGGLGAVLELAARVKQPDLVAGPLGEKILGTVDEFRSAIQAAMDLTSSSGDVAAQVLSGWARRRFPKDWPLSLSGILSQNRWSAERAVRLLASWEDSGDNWDYFETLGSNIARKFWKTRRPFSFAGPLAELKRGVKNFLAEGRASAALSFSYKRFNELEPSLLVEMLDALVPEINSSEDADHMATHLATQAISTLRSSGLTDEEIARIEYAYLPVLKEEETPLVIYRLLASRPGFYVSLIESVFLADGDSRNEAKEEDESKRAKWRADYRLLSEFELLPGYDGESINYEVLLAWVHEVRTLAGESKRVAITDQYIGHVLAHAPSLEADEAWPPLQVAKVIEDVASYELERGFLIECHNKRGVYSKALFEGGNQERQLADKYRTWGSAMVDFPRTAALLESVAASWERDAEREDLRARQDMLKE